MHALFVSFCSCCPFFGGVRGGGGGGGGGKSANEHDLSIVTYKQKYILGVTENLHSWEEHHKIGTTFITVFSFLFQIKPSGTAQRKPLLVFINPKSGGNQVMIRSDLLLSN